MRSSNLFKVLRAFDPESEVFTLMMAETTSQLFGLLSDASFRR